MNMNMNMNMNIKNDLNPSYISGLVQADGSFFVIITRNKNSYKGLRLRPKFTITQDLDSLPILLEIQRKFQCGNIVIIKSKQAAELVVDSRKDLINIIIPHFNRFPLYCAKYKTFKLWSQVINMIDSKLHYHNYLILANIIKTIYNMNTTTNRKLSNYENLLKEIGIKNINEVTEIEITSKNSPTNIHLNPQFLSGFVHGDGCFSIIFNKESRITLEFNITNDIENLELLEEIKKYLGCGSIIKSNNKGSSRVIRLVINNLKDINNILIPFFDQNPTLGKKGEYYTIFAPGKKVNQILTNPTICTNEHIKNKEEIINLAYNMNKGGKRRKLDKEAYINELKLHTHKLK